MTEMLLAVDVGNTQTVIGLYDLAVVSPASAEEGLLGHWRASTLPDRTADELAVLIDGFLATVDRKLSSDLAGVSVASGVPPITSAMRAMTHRYLNLEPVVVGPGVRSGVPIRYDNPREVGADRIANAVGALDLYDAPIIVVDFGTGTTFDAIGAEGEYLGGAIAPGVEISLEALISHAAALSSVELVEPRGVIGKSTAESLRSGVIYGYAAQVDGICRRMTSELGASAVVGTGGLALLITPHTECVQEVQPWLTLHGLRKIWWLNTKG